eukprot:Rhum_TRINITY_DN14638_c2_g2::Rhum_TRINITY_DN14638_c2_g2_i1::g.105486::m.105486
MSQSTNDTVLSFIKRRAAAVPVVTGIAAVDKAGVAHNGLLGGERVVLTGARGTGKTQTLLHLTAATLLTHPAATAVSVVYLDCEGTFDARRLRDILVARLGGSAAQATHAAAAAHLGRVAVATPRCAAELAAAILDAAEQAAEAEAAVGSGGGGGGGVKLLVVDGLATLAAADPAARVNLPALLSVFRNPLVTVAVAVSPVVYVHPLTAAAPTLGRGTDSEADAETIVPQPQPLARQLVQDLDPSVVLALFAVHASAYQDAEPTRYACQATLAVQAGKVAATLSDRTPFRITPDGISCGVTDSIPPSHPV